MADTSKSKTKEQQDDGMKGMRKMIAVIVVSICMSATIISMVIVQPANLDLLEAIEKLGYAYVMLMGVFGGANLYEHYTGAPGKR